MGRLSDAWAALTKPDISDELAAKAAAIVGATFGLDAAKTDAQGLLQGVFPWGLPPKRGTREAMLLYSASPWLRAVVQRVALRVASTRWKLFAVKGQDGKARKVKAFDNASAQQRAKLWKSMRRKSAEVVEIEDHPMIDFLYSGNLVLDGRSAWQVSQTHWDIKGDVYWLLMRHESGPLKGKPSEWWPVPSFWVQATPTVSTPFFRFQYAGWQAMVPETEVVWARDPDPANPYGRGVGIAESLSDELMSDENASKFVNSWFYNRGLPATIVTFKGAKVEADRIQHEWQQRYGGVLKAFQTHFTNSDVQVNQLSQTFEQQQILQLRDQMKHNILQTFGYPGELLGDLSNANRSTIDTAAYRLEKYCVEPRREFWRHVLQNRIAPEWDERLIVEYENEVPEDREFVMQAMKVRPYAFTNDEVRDLVGMDETDGDWGGERPPTPTVAPVDKEVVPGGGGGMGAQAFWGTEPAWARELRGEVKRLTRGEPEPIDARRLLRGPREGR